MESIKLGNRIYSVIGKLGRGGTCEVFSIQCERTCENFALKVLQGTHNARRFRREFRSMTKLNHPNIARVYEYGEYEGKPCYSMEYIAGGDMKEWLMNEIGVVSSGSGQAPQTAVDFYKIADKFRSICKPLAYIHSRKILHRDLKPANIMFTEHGDVKLMDFGLIKEMDIIQETLTRTGTFVGTVAYMSPEQGMGRQLDHRSDLYSLGVVMYESLTGRLPFLGSTVVEVLMKHISAEPEPPANVNPKIPDALQKLTMTLLKKDPSERIESADKILDHLNAFDCLESTTDTIESNVLTDTSTAESYTIQGLLVPGLVGRQKEKEAIRAALNELERYKPGIISICGELGTGKTALALEAGTMARIRGRALLKGDCSEIERFPYSAFLAPLKAISERIIHKEETFGKDILGNTAPVLASICPDFLKIPWVCSDKELEPLEPKQNKLRIFDAIQSVLENMARQNPLILILEDLQWADDLSYEFIFYLCRNLARTDRAKPPILLLITWRPEEMPNTGMPARFSKNIRKISLHTGIVLKHLDDNNAENMIKAMLGPGEVDHVVIREVIQDSGGNPFFIEEILKNLVENKILCRMNNKWTFDLTTTKNAFQVMASGSFLTGTLSIPERVKEVISQRLEKLSEETMKNLRVASVIGNEFLFEELQKITGIDEDSLLDQVDQAIREDIVIEVKGSGGELFRFRQNMIRQVLYSSLSDRRVASIHRKVAQYIENKYGKLKSEQSEILAYHHDKAGNVNQAAVYYLQACDNALHYSAQMTLKYALRLLELSEELDGDNLHIPELKMIVFKYLGLAYDLVGNPAESNDAYQKLLDYSIDMNNSFHEAVALQFLGCNYMSKGEYEKAQEYLGNALKSGLKCNSKKTIHGELLDVSYKEGKDTSRIDKLLAGIMADLASVYMYQGRFRNSLKTFDVIAEKMRDTGIFSGLAMCRVYQGLNHYYLGEYSEALKHLNEAVEIYDKYNFRYKAAKTMNNIGGVYLSMGDSIQAMDYFNRALQIAREIGDLSTVSAAQGNLGIIYEERGFFRKSADSSEEALVISRKLGDRPGVVTYLINLCSNRLKLGDFSQIDIYLEEALQTSERMGDRLLQVSAMEIQAEYLLTRGDLKKSMEMFQAIIEISSEAGLKANILKAYSHLALIKTLEGTSDSVEMAERAVAESERLGDLPVILVSYQRLAEIQLHLRNYDKVRDVAAIGLRLASKSEHLFSKWLFLSYIGRSWSEQEQPRRAVVSYRMIIEIFYEIRDQMTPHSANCFFQQQTIFRLLMDVKDTADLLQRMHLLKQTNELLRLSDFTLS
jgi:serine/threonine protein kinase/tetratricopeptide (TPR) repeat protein